LEAAEAENPAAGQLERYADNVEVAGEAFLLEKEKLHDQKKKGFLLRRDITMILVRDFCNQILSGP